ncbi:MAG TPA: Cof-type HAD-IIB family hydrolase [Phycisphaerae bacterium]|nr:Cof-type HAD-IIB family hydrolase [Phycisphaerae bacterium]
MSSNSAPSRTCSPFALIAIDLDGTLLTSRNELSAANRAALRRAHEAGMHICLCTGRSLVESQSVIQQIGLDLSAGVFVFGAMVADVASGEVLFRNAMTPELADRLVAFLRSRGHCVLALYDPSQNGCDYVLIEGTRNRDAYEKWLEITPARAERWPEWHPRDYTPLRIGIIENPDHIEETLREIRAAFPEDQAKINSIYAPNYRLHVVECFAPVVNKWYGITQLAGRLGIPLERVAAVGDDVNDLEMIANAGLGVAMGNAIPAIKAVARWQTETNDRDGVAVLIDRILAGDFVPPQPKP